MLDQDQRRLTYTGIEGRYVHYKHIFMTEEERRADPNKFTYNVLGIVHREVDLCPLVAYQPLYGPHPRPIMTRPIEEFYQLVSTGRGLVSRFERPEEKMPEKFHLVNAE